MRGIRTGLVMSAIVVGACVPAWAAPHTFEELGRGGGVVVDHQPRRLGGVASDTAFWRPYVPWPEEVWERSADDVLLADAAVIRRVSWWGFYWLNDLPPLVETMRVRFYDARPDDGLPGQVLHEESFLNPTRVATGYTVLENGLPDEYVYEVDLTTPVALDANIPYWLEIAQIGEVDSTFLMEYSETDLTGIAFINNLVPDWTFLPTIDLAFQLSTVPEPNTLGLLACGFIVLWRRRRGEEKVSGRFS